MEDSGGIALGCMGDLSATACDDFADIDCCGAGIIASLCLPTPLGAPGARTGLACLGTTGADGCLSRGDCCLSAAAAPPDWAGGIIASLGEGFLITGCEKEF